MASGGSSLDQLTQLYKHVIDDVVRNMREEYLNEGMDTELLEELKQVWLSKLNLSGAVNRPVKDIPARSKETPTKNAHKHSNLVQNSVLAPNSASSSSSSTATVIGGPPPLISPPQVPPSSGSSSSSSPKTGPAHSIPITPSVTAVNLGGIPSTVGHTSRVPQAAVSSSVGVAPAVNPFTQLGMVAAPGGNAQMGQFAQGMFPIQTPNGTVLVNLQTFMALNKLHQQQQQQPSPQKQSTSSASQATPPTPEKGKDVVQIDGLPPQVGVVNTKIGTSKSKHVVGRKQVVNSPIPMLKIDSNSKESDSGSKCVPDFVIPQLDGYGSGNKGGVAAEESSSEDDSDGEDSSAEDPGSAHEDIGSPLNSDDDIDGDLDDPDASDDFETLDVMVCQWEKVYRVKNKWKFLLKDGVMHLNGYDYVFHKVSGEADW